MEVGKVPTPSRRAVVAREGKTRLLTQRSVTADLEAAAARLRSNAICLTSMSPNAPLDALEPLRTLIGSARVVALGEGAHFIDELWTVRQRLVRFLHEQLGFQIIDAEFDIDEADELEAWLAAPSEPQPLEAVSRGASE